MLFAAPRILEKKKQQHKQRLLKSALIEQHAMLRMENRHFVRLPLGVNQRHQRTK